MVLGEEEGGLLLDIEDDDDDSDEPRRFSSSRLLRPSDMIRNWSGNSTQSVAIAAPRQEENDVQKRSSIPNSTNIYLHGQSSIQETMALLPSWHGSCSR